MLNYLRSDLYRAWKTLWLPAIMICTVAFGALPSLGGSVFLLIAQAATNSPVSSTEIGTDMITAVAQTGFSTSLSVLICAYVPLYLIAVDNKAGTRKTLYADPRARRSYILAKLALAAASCFALNALSLGAAALAPYLGGLPYLGSVTLSEVAVWWLFESLVCCAYSFVVVFLATLCKGETSAWVVCALVLLGIAGQTAYFGLIMLQITGVLDAETVQTATNWLLLTAKTAVSSGQSAVADGSAGISAYALTPLPYLAIGVAGAWAAIRRKTV